MHRRQFLTATAAVLTARKGWGAASDDFTVEIQSAAPIGRIDPMLHGHFAEHLGSCIYGGLWVGKNSAVPNINGHRKQAVEWLKALGIPVLRWPGGCFADDYHWRDGIGARRPSRVNVWWGMYTEDNSFGTHEFLELCRLIGAEPYIAGNVGSGTPAELRDWMEYCNYPRGSTLSDERAANGSPEPFRVKYWGVGNENWGCGGRMTAGEYATLYRRYSTYCRPFGGEAPFLIACGPNGNNLDWTKTFFENMRERRTAPPNGYAMHYYQRVPNDGALAFKPDQMYAQFELFDRTERAIVEQRALMDVYDPKRQSALLVDEWGIWDRALPEEEKKYGKLWQQITTRCGVGAALGLNAFHRQADKVTMGNIAQTVNVIHSLLLTYQDKCVRTPTYHAFELEKPHRGKTAVKTSESRPGLSVSASHGAGEAAITVVNPRHDRGARVRCVWNGGRLSGAKARVLAHDDLNACNTFEAPETVVPRDLPVVAEGGAPRFDLPPLAVATVIARL